MSTKNYVTGNSSGSLAAGDDPRLNSVVANTVAITKLTLTPTLVKTTNYSAAIQDLVLCNATSSAFTVTLPIAPTDGSLVEVKKLDATTNAITMVTGGSDTFSIGTTSAALSLQGQAALVRYQSSSQMWVGVGDVMPLAAMDARYLTQSSALSTYATKTYIDAISDNEMALANFKSLNASPMLATNTFGVAASSTYGVKMYTRAMLTPSQVGLAVATGGDISGGSGYYFALYDSSGNYYANSVTNDAASTFIANSYAYGTPASSPTIPAGIYFVLFRSGTATTQPTVRVLTGGPAPAVNIGMGTVPVTLPSVNAPRFFTSSATWSGTTPPPSLGNITAVNGPYLWIGVK